MSFFNLLESGRCRHQAILRHFDEQMGPCRTSCDVCTGVTAAELASGFRVGGVIETRSRKPARSRTVGRPAPEPPDEALFESLRALRKELAAAQGVPAYIVFSDKVLLEMATRRPTTLAEMLEVPGIGPAKLRRYGQVFLDLLRDPPFRSQR